MQEEELKNLGFQSVREVMELPAKRATDEELAALRSEFQAAERLGAGLGRRRRGARRRTNSAQRG